MKPRMPLKEIIIFSLYHVIVRHTKIIKDLCKESTVQTHPCNENRVLPVKFFSQGKTCFHYRDGFAVYIDCIYVLALQRSFIILVSLTMTCFSKKIMISYTCIRGFMPNLHKKKS